MNGIFFQGKMVVKSEDVEIVGTELILQNLNSRFHDMLYKVKIWECTFYIGLQNQNYIDYRMQVRALEYTVGEYDKQCRQIQKKHKKEKDLKGNAYLSGFSAEDRLHPVYVLVLYYGAEKWETGKSLHDILDLGKTPREYQNQLLNYQMRLVSVMELEDLTVFRTDVRLLFEFIQCQNNIEKLKAFLEKYRESGSVDRDLVEAMLVLSKTKGVKRVIENTYREGEDVDMCRAIEELIQERAREEIAIAKERGIKLGEEYGIEIGEKRGMEIGEKRGIEIGELRVRRETALSLEEMGIAAEKIAQILKVSMEMVREWLGEKPAMPKI